MGRTGQVSGKTDQLRVKSVQGRQWQEISGIWQGWLGRSGVIKLGTGKICKTHSWLAGGGRGEPILTSLLYPLLTLSVKKGVIKLEL